MLIKHVHENDIPGYNIQGVSLLGKK